MAEMQFLKKPEDKAEKKDAPGGSAPILTGNSYGAMPQSGIGLFGGLARRSAADRISPEITPESIKLHYVSEPLTALQPQGDAPVQRMEGESAVEAPVRETENTPNQTGIPDGMKSRFEAMSGLSFDDVRIHYSSAKPAQLQALAYTQGNQVYVGPGQEKHLPHELGHVVQQKQGRVKPTAVLGKVEVNDNTGLEREASLLGEQAAQIKDIELSESLLQNNICAGETVQMAGHTIFGAPIPVGEVSVRGISLEPEKDREECRKTLLKKISTDALAEVEAESQKKIPLQVEAKKEGEAVAEPKEQFKVTEQIIAEGATKEKKENPLPLEAKKEEETVVEQTEQHESSGKSAGVDAAKPAIPLVESSIDVEAENRMKQAQENIEKAIKESDSSISELVDSLENRIAGIKIEFEDLLSKNKDPMKVEIIKNDYMRVLYETKMGYEEKISKQIEMNMFLIMKAAYTARNVANSVGEKKFPEMYNAVTVKFNSAKSKIVELVKDVAALRVPVWPVMVFESFGNNIGQLIEVYRQSVNYPGKSICVLGFNERKLFIEEFAVPDPSELCKSLAPAWLPGHDVYVVPFAWTAVGGSYSETIEEQVIINMLNKDLKKKIINSSNYIAEFFKRSESEKNNIRKEVSAEISQKVDGGYELPYVEVRLSLMDFAQGIAKSSKIQNLLYRWIDRDAEEDTSGTLGEEYLRKIASDWNEIFVSGAYKWRPEIGGEQEMKIYEALNDAEIKLRTAWHRLNTRYDINSKLFYLPEPTLIMNEMAHDKAMQNLKARNKDERIIKQDRESETAFGGCSSLGNVEFADKLNVTKPMKSGYSPAFVALTAKAGKPTEGELFAALKNLRQSAFDNGQWAFIQTEQYKNWDKPVVNQDALIEAYKAEIKAGNFNNKIALAQLFLNRERKKLAAKLLDTF